MIDLYYLCEMEPNNNDDNKSICVHLIEKKTFISGIHRYLTHKIQIDSVCKEMK